ncbi:glycosyltransferase family 4 protein [Candidatus Hecatella orcuttiae]|jgi:glycosyltransferase involved in cell wall biosynthesis|uniref:glycosyltransferase family 4 protein n=1 Tax=Candidatus Hecatella orcuttiae TaxID=1935119 RepID=UPI002867CD7C|nr:glycosyltransferase family 4 protein [Candidatus Hecatella orcuttiae]
MRIVQVRQKFPLDGGVEVHVYHLCKKLVERGHDVTVFASDRDLFWRRSYSCGLQHIDGIKVRRFRAWGKVFRNLLIPSMFRALMNGDFDIVHAHGHFYNTTEMAALASKLSGKPLVITPHFQPYWAYLDRKERLARMLYERSVARPVFQAAKKIVAVSPYTKTYLVENFGVKEEKVHVVPNGLDLSRFTNLPDGWEFRERFGISGLMVLFVGHLSQRKGVRYLVQAIPQVLKSIPDAVFVFVGVDRGEKSLLESLIKQFGVDSHVVFTGYMPDEELTSAYAAADLFVLPSLFEAFGITLLEAMACGLPIVATKVGGIPHVVLDGQTGLLVEAGDASQLADALVTLLSDRALAKKMGELGRKVAQEYGWNTVCDKILKVYDKALSA